MSGLRYLESYGYKSWEEFVLNSDVSVGQYSTFVCNFYHGYSYVWPSNHVRDDSLNYAPLYKQILVNEETLIEVLEYLDSSCKGKWRYDRLRSWWDHQTQLFTVEPHGNPKNMIFFAFQEERDYTLFLLAWGDYAKF